MGKKNKMSDDEMSIEEPQHAVKKMKLIIKNPTKPTNAKRVKRKTKLGDKVMKSLSKSVNGKKMPKTLQQKQ